MTDHEKHLAVIRDYVHDPFGDAPNAVPLYSHDDFIRALNHAISALERLPLLEAKAVVVDSLDSYECSCDLDDENASDCEACVKHKSAVKALHELEAKAKGGE